MCALGCGRCGDSAFCEVKLVKQHHRSQRTMVVDMLRQKRGHTIERSAQDTIMLTCDAPPSRQRLWRSAHRSRHRSRHPPLPLRQLPSCRHRAARERFAGDSRSHHLQSSSSSPTIAERSRPDATGNRLLEQHQGCLRSLSQPSGEDGSRRAGESNGEGGGGGGWWSHGDRSLASDCTLQQARPSRLSPGLSGCQQK